MRPRSRRPTPRARRRPSRPSRRSRRSARPMPERILALVSEPVGGEALRSAVGGRADGAEVLVIAPALNSRTRFLFSDADPAIERAEAVVEETVEQMGEDGVRAAGDTG